MCMDMCTDMRHGHVYRHVHCTGSMCSLRPMISLRPNASVAVPGPRPPIRRGRSHPSAEAAATHLLSFEPPGPPRLERIDCSGCLGRSRRPPVGVSGGWDMWRWELASPRPGPRHPSPTPRPKAPVAYTEAQGTRRLRRGPRHPSPTPRPKAPVAYAEAQGARRLGRGPRHPGHV